LLEKERTNQQNPNFIGSFGFVLIIAYGHTNASLLIASGTNLQTVAKRLSHANVITTGKIYSHAIKSADEAAVEALQDILHPVTKKV